MEFTNWFEYDSTVPCIGGGQVEIWKFNYQYDIDAFDEWAKHFRNQYCSDKDIDQLRKYTGKNREDYLLDFIFPDKHQALGPSTRSGDFAEILITDFLEFVQKYWTPRIRYDRKDNRNTPTKGSDVIAIKIKDDPQGNPCDELIVYEIKARISSKKNDLNEAIKHSSKDLLRIAESLNKAANRFFYDRDQESYDKIGRIQQMINIAKKPCSYGAALVCSNNLYNQQLVSDADVTNHPQNANLRLLLVKANDLRAIVHSLYSWAAHEA